MAAGYWGECMMLFDDLGGVFYILLSTFTYTHAHTRATREERSERLE